MDATPPAAQIALDWYLVSERRTFQEASLRAFVGLHRLSAGHPGTLAEVFEHLLAERLAAPLDGLQRWGWNDGGKRITHSPGELEKFCNEAKAEGFRESADYAAESLRSPGPPAEEARRLVSFLRGIADALDPPEEEPWEGISSTMGEDDGPQD